ncbi:dihydroneopterin aldolase [candidate division KSB1 bacterium]|nr:dihydroneopterin aldolase [candidate division KSB1 bacterium]
MIAKIKNLRLRAILGVHEWERKNKQDLIVNVEFEFDGRPAANSDQIEDTVDYKSIKKEVIKLVESSSFQLVETLVERICDLVMKDERVEQVSVEVDKPHALRFADSVSISTTRSRSA